MPSTPGRATAVDATEIARNALRGGRYPVARLVSLLEDTRPTATPARDEALVTLESSARARAHHGQVIGLTGSPGSGKSSLLSGLADRMTTIDPEIRVAIVAVDPSSPTSKGALLGDRTRMSPSPNHSRIFFRSQASANALGGLAPSTYHVCHGLSLLFDVVIVETVGVGQSEADIRHLADRVYLVLAPLGGDEIQYLKAGIIEIPDAFIVNKWDEPTASKTFHQLRSTLWLARPADGNEIPIHRASAKSGYGLDDLAGAFLRDVRAAPPRRPARAEHFFRAWVTAEWGRTGERHLTGECGGAAAFLSRYPGFSAAQVAFEDSLIAHLRR